MFRVASVAHISRNLSPDYSDGGTNAQLCCTSLAVIGSSVGADAEYPSSIPKNWTKIVVRPAAPTTIRTAICHLNGAVLGEW